MKKNQYTMSRKDASETFENVLAAWDRPASSSGSRILSDISRPEYDFRLLTILVCAALVIVLLMPLPFAIISDNSRTSTAKADITVDEYTVEDGWLYLDLNGQFIDYSSIYAVDSTGANVYPMSYDSRDGMVVFDYDETEWNIYVSDLNGTTVHMLFTPQQ